VTIADWSLFISIGSVVVVLIVGLMAYKAVKEGVRDQNLLTLARDIQSDSQRKARGVVYELGKRRASEAIDVIAWSDTELDAVERTCQLFQLALFMEERKMVPKNSISEPWADAIERCWVVAFSHIAKRQSLEGFNLWVDRRVHDEPDRGQH